jgi:hypothetical protein
MPRRKPGQLWKLTTNLGSVWDPFIVHPNMTFYKHNTPGDMLLSIKSGAYREDVTSLDVFIVRQVGPYWLVLNGETPMYIQPWYFQTYGTHISG